MVNGKLGIAMSKFVARTSIMMFNSQSNEIVGEQIGHDNRQSASELEESSFSSAQSAEIEDPPS